MTNNTLKLEGILEGEQLENYEKMLILDRTDKQDYERKALFYLIASDRGLTKRVGEIYNFKEGVINIDYLNNLEELGKLSDSSIKLLMLGANLYNGYTSELFDASTMGILYALDDKQRQVFIRAIKIRLGLEE